MPTLKRRSARRADLVLTFHGRFGLLTGAGMSQPLQNEGWQRQVGCPTSLDGWRELWGRHRDPMIQWTTARKPGVRPYAYWQFETGVPSNLRADNADDLAMERLAWLRDHHELNDAELTALERAR